MSHVALSLLLIATLTLSGGLAIRYEDFLQPDDVISGRYDGLNSSDPHLCTRTCRGDKKICYYKFYVENYSAMGVACQDCPSNKTHCSLPQCIPADGVERGIITVNRMIPGPSLQVCKGDTVVVDVVNAMPAASASIHWHGVRQRGSYYMDGVPMITQCPILPAQTFRYHFVVDEPGTHFWHSHSGLQKIDGFYGSLVVREPKEEVIVGDAYDDDLPSHVITIIDWMHLNAEQKLPGLRTPPNTGQLPNTYLINGRGIHAKTTTELIQQLSSNNHVPLSEFIVKPGRRYRFRVVASTCTMCPYILTFQMHNMTVIAGDAAGPVQPTPVNNIAMTSGERYDFVIEANQRVGQYWIVLKGLGDCRDLVQLAVLKYEGSTKMPPVTSFLKPPTGLTLNYPNSFCDGFEPDRICFHHLKSAYPVHHELSHGNSSRIHRMHLAFGSHYYELDNLFGDGIYNKFMRVEGGRIIKSLVSNISFVPPASPLASQREDIPQELFCKNSCDKALQEKPCDCLHIYEVPASSIVELVISDTLPYTPGGISHPFHLHGYNFHVIEQGIFKDGPFRGLQEIYRRLDAGNLTHEAPPLKDTVAIPAGGFVVVRFLADNPGYWFMHCHIAFHLDMGMAAVFQIGDPATFPQPPSGFPKCGNYLPEVLDDFP